MNTLISGNGAKVKHRIDFTPLPYGVILMELAVFATQLPNNASSSLGNLIVMRLLHTVGMLVLSLTVARVLILLSKTELNYLSIAVICTLVIALGDIGHGYLASIFDIQLVSSNRRFGIILLQGLLWFPALMIVLGKRRDIIKSFKDYELRLTVATRARSRTSDEFKELQISIQDRIRGKLYTLCDALKDSITANLKSTNNLMDRNNAIRPFLLSDELRTFSRGLENYESVQGSRTLFGDKLRSISVLFQQFKILYATSIRTAPLNKSAYIWVLIALATPPYINFYSLKESLVYYPILLILVFVCAGLITKLQRARSNHALRTSSILIFLTGTLPFLCHLIAQLISDEPQFELSILVTNLAIPFVYYIFMELLQILRPSALTLIQNDELLASSALQNQISKIILNELSHNISHQWAVFIHGKILTRLAVTSLKLQSLSATNDTKAFDETIERLLKLLRKPDTEFELMTEELQKEVISRLDPWVGLLKIELYIDPSLRSIQGPRVRDVGEVIEELISNSIRHGKSKEIQLKIHRSGATDIEIVAIDNAVIHPNVEKQIPGLGTHIFNLVSDGRWSITRIGSTTEFRLTMGFGS